MRKAVARNWLETFVWVRQAALFWSALLDSQMGASEGWCLEKKSITLINVEIMIAREGRFEDEIFLAVLRPIPKNK